MILKWKRTIENKILSHMVHSPLRFSVKNLIFDYVRRHRKACQYTFLTKLSSCSIINEIDIVTLAKRIRKKITVRKMTKSESFKCFSSSLIYLYRSQAVWRWCFVHSSTNGYSHIDFILDQPEVIFPIHWKTGNNVSPD